MTAPDLARTPLASYTRYYRSIALAGLNRMPEALSLLEGLEAEGASGASGYLFGEAIPLRRADLEVARQNARRALEILSDLSKQRSRDLARGCADATRARRGGGRRS